ncbi:ABC transporter substrate-binding protein [Brachybacterium endophyticum]|uniref:ABC transporter substrate-binding protein n=1 Tax=Brachybacterium endophyticum TaxID=2182385 RepID=A0A2U2RLM5_9MICO|nr:ABC transporter substrate-binding protein [Brachybacterium endophyticum]PWH06770.1 ABC transporter substrate-binding protein [Brachybacterium endophyticum]
MPSPSRSRRHDIGRRSLLGGLGLGAAGLALGACGSPGAGDNDPSDPIREKFSQARTSIPKKYRNRTPIVFWAPFSGVNYEAVQAVFERFNESQDEIVALSESQTDYASLNQKFTAAIQARQVPDIVCFPEMQWLQFYFAGALARLDDYFDDEWNLDVYIENYVAESVAAGHTYVVPFARSTPLFYFNRDQYRKAGLPEDGPKTWDDLAEFAPELAKIEVSGKPLKTVAFGSADSWYAQADIWAFGGRNSKGLKATMNDERGVDWLEWQRRFIHEDHFGYMAQSPDTDFTTGLVAGTRQSTAALRNLTELATFDVGCAFMPGQVNAPTQVPTGGSGLSIVRSDSKDRQDACAELFRFLAKPEISAQWHKETGYVPIVTKARDTDIVKNLVKQNPNYGVALDQLPRAHTADTSNWFQSSARVIEEGLTSVYGDNADAKGALDAIAEGIQKIMDDNSEALQEVIG